MTVTYIKNILGFNVPKLHKVIYPTEDVGINTLKDLMIAAWLKENCEHGYYHSPGYPYVYEKAIEFESEKDAMLFSLRWL